MGPEFFLPLIVPYGHIQKEVQWGLNIIKIYYKHFYEYHSVPPVQQWYNKK
jgi:hypothetical protein